MRIQASVPVSLPSIADSRLAYEMEELSSSSPLGNMTRLPGPGVKFSGKEKPGKSKRDDCTEAIVTTMSE